MAVKLSATSVQRPSRALSHQRVLDLSEGHDTPAKRVAPQFCDLLIYDLRIDVNEHVLIRVMKPLQCVLPMRAWYNDNGVRRCERQIFAGDAPLPFPRKIDDRVGDGLETDMPPSQFLRETTKIVIWLIDRGPSTTLVDPPLFEH